MKTDTMQTDTAPTRQGTDGASSDEGTPLFDEILRRNGISSLDDGTEAAATADTAEAAAPTEPVKVKQPDTAPVGAHAKPEPSESDGQASE